MAYDYEKLDIMDNDVTTGDYVFKESIQRLIDDQTLDINYCIILCINFYYFLIHDYTPKQYEQKEIDDIRSKLSLIKKLITDKLKDSNYHDTFIIGNIAIGIENLYFTGNDKTKIDQIKDAAIYAIKKLKGIPAAS
jgi:hypothetical protein